MIKHNWVPKCNIKRKDFDNGGHVINFNVHAESLREWLAEAVREGTYVNDSGYLTLCITENKNGPTEWGATHGAYLSTFIPKPKEGNAAPTSSEPSSELTADEIPF